MADECCDECGCENKIRDSLDMKLMSIYDQANDFNYDKNVVCYQCRTFMDQRMTCPNMHFRQLCSVQFIFKLAFEKIIGLQQELFLINLDLQFALNLKKPAGTNMTIQMKSKQTYVRISCCFFDLFGLSPTFKIA